MTLFARAVQDVDVDELSSALPSDDLDLWDYGRAALILVVAIIASRIVKLVIQRVLARGNVDDFICDLLGRLAAYAVVVFGLVYALEELGVAVGPVLGALGIIGVALAFALQDILENFVAGIILQARRPFSSGDEIVSAELEGLVLSVDSRTVTIRTPDGETVRIPSADLIKNPITNLTELGRRRSTVTVGVAYGTDVDRVSRIAIGAAQAVDGVLPSPPVEAYVEQFGPSSIDFAIRYWHAPTIAEQWRMRHQVSSALADAFEANDIAIPFPQRTLHLGEQLVVADPG